MNIRVLLNTLFDLMIPCMIPSARSEQWGILRTRNRRKQRGGEESDSMEQKRKARSGKLWIWMARRRDLNKLKRQELLEIMLAQGREIDRLREQVADLQEQLDDRTIAIEKAGSIAKASLALTKVFEEAQKAADLYLYNVSGGRDGKGGSSKGWEHGRED